MAEHSPEVYVLVLPDDESASDAHALVSTAGRVAGPGAVAAIVVSSGPHEELASQLLTAGARCVTLASHPSMVRPAQTEQLLSVLVQAIAAVCDDQASALFLFPATSLGDELSARSAARLGGTALGRCQEISIDQGRLVAHRAAFGGRVDVKLQATGTRSFASIRAARGGGTAPELAAVGPGAIDRQRVRMLQVPGPLPAPMEVDYSTDTAQAQPLESARVVVSGGRGMGGPEGFEQLRALAAALGGVVAGSLPAVDAGWVPVASQVGQSGKYVTPCVYVAVGISGTLQHLAGIGEEVPIAAINSDPEANIFKEAQVGIVGDWRTVLPLIVEAALSGRGDGATDSDARATEQERT